MTSYTEEEINDYLKEEDAEPIHFPQKRGARLPRSAMAVGIPPRGTDIVISSRRGCGAWQVPTGRREATVIPPETDDAP